MIFDFNTFGRGGIRMVSLGTAVGIWGEGAWISVLSWALDAAVWALDAAVWASDVVDWHGSTVETTSSCFEISADTFAEEVPGRMAGAVGGLFSSVRPLVLSAL
jgi:hypothetical protein